MSHNRTHSIWTLWSLKWKFTTVTGLLTQKWTHIFKMCMQMSAITLKHSHPLTWVSVCEYVQRSLIHPPYQPTHTVHVASVKAEEQNPQVHRLSHKSLLCVDNTLKTCNLVCLLLTHQPPLPSTWQRTCPQRFSLERRAAGLCVWGWGLPLYPWGGSTWGSARHQTWSAKPPGSGRFAGNKRGK